MGLMVIEVFTLRGITSNSVVDLLPGSPQGFIVSYSETNKNAYRGNEFEGGLKAKEQELEIQIKRGATSISAGYTEAVAGIPGAYAPASDTRLLDLSDGRHGSQRLCEILEPRRGTNRPKQSPSWTEL